MVSCWQKEVLQNSNANSIANNCGALYSIKFYVLLYDFSPQQMKAIE